MKVGQVGQVKEVTVGMRGTLHRLKDKQIKVATKPICDGGGLWLQVRGEARTWIFRYDHAGQRRNMGLGSYPAVTLAEARKRAAECRELRTQGIDPLAHRRGQDSAPAAPSVPTFTSVAARYIRSKRRAWSNIRHAREWPSSLKRYARAIIGSTPVDQIDTASILKVLEPVWHKRPETASRVQSRLENILDYAAAMGWRDPVNPARWRGHLSRLLPSPQTIKRQQNGGAEPHYEAIPYPQVPAFVAELRKLHSFSARALEFAILTATRTGEVLGAQWVEVDLAAATWTIPAVRMKARVEHRVPLSNRALEILQALPRIYGNPYVFPGSRDGKPMSSMALLMCMRGLGHGVNGAKSGAVPHGFRSSFRDWVAEETGFPAAVAEAALAHTITNAVQAAYERGDKFRKRRELMQAWAEYCAQA